MYPCFFMQYKQMEKRFMYILKTEASFWMGRLFEIGKFISTIKSG